MGPLHGVRVLEIASAAPVPFAGMVLADLGADVVRVDRGDDVSASADRPLDPLTRGKRSVAVDLKHAHGPDVVLNLVGHADVLLEGFRPGVMERLGLGPDVCLAANPRLVYGRLTGWGQDGPLAPRAGHDINYIGLAGALEPIGRAGEPPLAPLNLVGDFGGGGMLLAVGVLAALIERVSSNKGQVIDAAMVDGASLLMSFIHGLRAQGQWRDERGTNVLDGGAPFYDTYETADGHFMSVGALERRFYAQLLEGLGLDGRQLPSQYDRSQWAVLRSTLAAAFKSQTREHWSAVFAVRDACVAPVLSPAEAAEDPHMRARGAFVDVDGALQPAPAPRFGRTAAEHPKGSPAPGEHSQSALEDWGAPPAAVAEWQRQGALVSPAVRAATTSHPVKETA